MKIYFVAGVFPPYHHGGAENYILRIAKKLKERGHEPHVITTQPYESLRSLVPSQEEYEGMDTWRFFPLNIDHSSTYPELDFVPKSLWRSLDIVNVHGAVGVKYVLQRTDADIVHTHNLVGISTLAGRAIQQSDAKHIHTLHDCNLLCPGGNPRSCCEPDLPEEAQSIKNDPRLCRVFSRIQHALLGDPDLVLAPSNDVIRMHRAHGFFDEVSVRKLRLGVEELASTPGTPESDVSVLFVGRVTELKGVRTLIESAERAPEIEFHICGTGPLEGVAQRSDERLTNLTYHGFVDEEELRRLRREAHFGIVPSLRRENSPMVIYESFAQGLPMIGSDFGGIPELIRPGRNGGLFAPGDPDDLVKTIRRLTPNNQQLRTNALEFARNHTLTQHVTELEREYEQVLSEPNG